MLIHFIKKINFSISKEKFLIHAYFFYTIVSKGDIYMSSIINLGHASFLLKAKDFEVVLDPYRDGSVPNLTFPKGIKADAVFCSHDHYDHDAKNLIKIKNNPKKVEVVEITVPHDHENGSKRGMNKIRMFDIDGYKVVHLGDTGCVLDEKTLSPIKNCDVILAPINGYFTISPDELKEICKIVKPRIVVPMHYYMKEKDSGYPDDNMFEKFLALFPEVSYLDKVLDLEEYKGYRGVLVFKNYLQ